jgi:microcystin-dependent protein
MDPYLSEIFTFSFDWAPQGFAQCDGQIMNASQNQALMALLSNLWGGDGRTTFGLPDLRGRVPTCCDNSSVRPGSKGGTETVVLTQATMPAHTHTFVASTDAADKRVPASNYLAPGTNVDGTDCPIFVPAPTVATSIVQMSPLTCSSIGAGLGHNNVQPSLALNFCIAMQGVFPCRN